MNDLVNCLRKWSRREAIAPGSLAEAADEIESLQARLAETEKWLNECLAWVPERGVGGQLRDQIRQWQADCA